MFFQEMAEKYTEGKCLKCSKMPKVPKFGKAKIRN